PQSVAPPPERDSSTRCARVAPRRRSRRARESLHLLRRVHRPPRRTDERREPPHMNVRRWPRLAVMALIRAYQLTLSHLVFTQCRFTASGPPSASEAADACRTLTG